MRRWADRAGLRELSDEVDHALTQQRFATGQTNLGDPHADQYASHSQIIFKRQVAIKCALIARAAINALVVTAVRDGDPQVGDGAAEFVGKAQIISGVLAPVILCESESLPRTAETATLPV